MKRTAALVMAAWTAAVSVSAQVGRIDWDNKNRQGDSIREILKGQPLPPAPQPREQDFRGGRGNDRGGDHRGGGGDRGDWGNRRGGRMNGRPERWDGSGIRAIAHKIDEEAARMLAVYAERSRSGNFFKKMSRQQGLAALDALSDAARRYHRELESRWSDPRETRENFRDLVRALDAAEDTMPMVYKGNEVRAQLACVSDAVEDLIRYYRFEDRFDNGPGGHHGSRPPRCEGVNFWGKWYEGGGCSIDGCWTYGGGCNTFGCWGYGGGCGVFGCWRQGGGCGVHGCVGGVPKLPSQPCRD